MQKRVNVLVRLHKAIQEKCTIQNISISLNSMSELHMKSKRQVKYQENMLLKKGKAFITETLHLVTNAFEDDNFSRQVLEKKDYVSVSKGVHKQKLQLAKVFVTCKNFVLLSKNIGFSKFCVQRPKWFVLAGSKMTHSVCI